MRDIKVRFGELKLAEIVDVARAGRDDAWMYLIASCAVWNNSR